jgi:hypothetical protein
VGRSLARQVVLEGPPRAAARRSARRAARASVAAVNLAPSPWLVAADLLDPQTDPYASDPVGWARDILGVHLWSRQQQIVESVRDHPRTAVRSGHGIGKTMDAAVACLWFLDVFPASRVITTATKWSQVEHLLWHEINQLHSRAHVAGRLDTRAIGRADPLKTKLELPDGRYALGLSSKPENSESFAGHHAPHILVVYDEASGIHPSIFEVGEGYMTTDGARALLIGNPTRTAGEFYDAFHSKRADYNCLHVSALESPAITGEQVPESLRAALTGREWVESRRRAWGEDSPLFQVRVLGNFPRRATDTVVDLGNVEDAQARELDIPVPAQLEDVVVACDVARFGSDETVIGTRHGPRVRVRRTYVGKATTETVGWIIDAWRELRDQSGAEARIVVDDDGVGGGVTDQLREKGYEVVAFNGGARALEPTRYPNARSESWFRMARRLPDLDLDEDDQLAADLTAPKYRLDSDGRRVVERKDETKKRLGRSPDRGDMALLTLVPTLAVTLPDEDDRRPAASPVEHGDFEATAPSGSSLTGDLLDDPM